MADYEDLLLMDMNEMSPEAAALHLKFVTRPHEDNPYYDRHSPLHDNMVRAVGRLESIADIKRTLPDGTPIEVAEPVVIDDRVGGLFGDLRIVVQSPNTVLSFEKGWEKAELEKAAC